MAEKKKAGKRKAYRKTGKNLAKILEALKQANNEGEDFVTLSELARRCGLHKWIVSRSLDLYMAPFVEITQPAELESVGLQLKLVKLKKPGTSMEQVVNYLKLRRKMNL